MRHFFADVEFLSSGKSVTVSSRPSDALAIAVRTDVPIYVADALLDAEGIILEEEFEDEEGEDTEAVVAEFRDFINDVRPEDFGSNT